MVSLILAVHLKEKMNVPDVPDNSEKLNTMEIQPVQNTSEVPSLTEKESRIEEDNDDNDGEEVLGALSNSEEESSEEDLLLGI